LLFKVWGGKWGRGTKGNQGKKIKLDLRQTEEKGDLRHLKGGGERARAKNLAIDEKINFKWMEASAICEKKQAPKERTEGKKLFFRGEPEPADTPERGYKKKKKKKERRKREK